MTTRIPGHEYQEAIPEGKLETGISIAHLAKPVFNDFPHFFNASATTAQPASSYPSITPSM